MFFGGFLPSSIKLQPEKKGTVTWLSVGKILIGFLYFTETMRSKLPVTVYLFLALYGFTTLQSRLFLKNIENFLCKKKLVNNCSIPSTHVERKITVHSHKHSFTPYPSLSPYWWTDRQRDKYTCYAWAGGTFFQFGCCVSFLVVAEIVLGDTYLPYQLCLCVFFLLRREIVFGCTPGQFFGCSGK